MQFSIFSSYIIYFSSFLLAAYFAKQYAYGRNNFKYISFFLAISIPALIAAIRGADVGTDYPGYYRIFTQMAEDINSVKDFSILESKVEIGFGLLVYVISRVISSIPVIVFFVYAFLASFILIGTTKIYHRKNVFYGYLFYLLAFWLFSYNGLRQAIAISIIFYSLSFVKDRKIIPFYLTVIFAMLFHKSAIIAAPFYFLFSKTKRKNTQIYLISNILGVLLIVLFLDKFANILNYDIYLTNRYLNANQAIINIVQQVFIISPLFIWRKKLILLDNYNRFYFYVLLLYILVQIVSIKISSAIRLVFYLEIVIIPISISLIQNISKFKTNRILIYLYLFLYLFVYRFLYIYYGSGKVIPYSIF